MKRRFLFGALLLAAAAAGTPVRADTLTGELRGQVIDVETGAPLIAARMALTSTDRGWTRGQVTDAQGRYAFVQLEPGNYTLQAESGGFYSVSRTDILIRLNRLRVLLPPFELRRVMAVPTREITLQSEVAKRAVIDLSAAGPTPVIIAVVEETGPDALVSFGDAALRFNFGADLLRVIPLGGSRSFDQLALLVPGVARVPFSSGKGPAVGLGVGLPGQFSVHGLRGRSNNYTVDGSDNNDEDVGVRRQGFLVEVQQNVESIQDFQVLTAGPPAELGRSAGAWVNAVSQSGATQLHGALSAMFGHHRLQAGSPLETPFSDTVNSASLNGGRLSGSDSRETQWTGVVGGAARSNLFYFGAAEYRSEAVLRVGHFVVPAGFERGLRTRNGLIPIAELGDFLASRNLPYRADAGSAVFSLMPLPNNPAGPFGEHNYSQLRRGKGDGLAASGKLDWHLRSDWTLTTRYNVTDDQQLLPFTGEALNSSLDTDTRTQNLSLFLNTVGSTWSHGLRISYGRTRLAFPPERGDPLVFGSDPQPGEASTPAIRTAYGQFGPFGPTGPIGQLQLHPFSPAGIDVFNFPQGRVSNSFQAAGAWTRSGGDHLVKFGWELRRTELNSFSDRNSRPLIVFTPGYISGTCMQSPSCVFATPDGLLSGTDAAALGAPAGVLQSLSTQDVPDSSIGLSFSRIEMFVQDDWRLTTRLSVNAGVRYELQTVPREARGRIEQAFGVSPADFSRLVPSQPSACGEDFPAGLYDAVICSGNAAFDRAVAAWNGFLEGRTRIYAGSRDDFSPRLGFAWDPTGHGSSVVRGGYWLIHEAQLGAVTSQSRNVFPTFIPVNLDLNFHPPSGRFLNNPGFFWFDPIGSPLVTPGSLNRYQLGDEAFATGIGTLFIQAPPFPGAPISSNGLAFTLPRREMKPGYAQHFTVGLEHRIGRHHVAAARYVGTRGRRLTRFQTPNAGLIATPVLFSTPLLGLSVLDLPPHPIAGGEGRPDPDLGAFTVIENSAASEYHALQLSIERRFRTGLQFQFHWTWSHALDEVSDPFESRGAPSLPQLSGRSDLEWGHAGFDVRHRSAGYFLWQPEWHRAKGWSLGGKLEVQSGQPFTVNTSLDRNLDGNLSDRPDRIAGIESVAEGSRRLALAAGLSPLDLLAPRGVAGASARNAFRTDGLLLLDLALARRFMIREQVELELKTEIFNLLNRHSYGVPIRILESPGFGSAYDLQQEPRAMRILMRLAF